jgi:hypothetical protein
MRAGRCDHIVIGLRGPESGETESGVYVDGGRRDAAGARSADVADGGGVCRGHEVIILCLARILPHTSRALTGEALAVTVLYNNTTVYTR